jgi:hypothetical protein
MEMDGKIRVPVKCEWFRRYVELDGERHYVMVKRTEDLPEVPELSSKRIVMGDKEFYLYSVVRIDKNEYHVKMDGGTEFIEVEE